MIKTVGGMRYNTETARCWDHSKMRGILLQAKRCIKRKTVSTLGHKSIKEMKFPLFSR